MNDKLKEYLNSVEKDIDCITDPSSFNTREEMGNTFEDFIGYDPTRIWDEKMMGEQIDKLTNKDGYVCTFDDREDAIERSLEHYDAIKSNVMLQVAQKTIKEMFGQEVTADDLNLDLDYLMNSEIFGIGYEDEDDDEDDGSLLDELNDDDDEIEGMDDDEDDLTD